MSEQPTPKGAGRATPRQLRFAITRLSLRKYDRDPGEFFPREAKLSTLTKPGEEAPPEIKPATPGSP